MERIRAGMTVVVAAMFLSLCGTFSVHAGGKPAAEQNVVTGNLRLDLFGMSELRDGPLLAPSLPPDPMPVRHRSPWVAAGLSLLVPGAGEFYAESYWKAAIFFAIDVTAAIIATKYNNQGNQQTDMFQGYANGHWSVVKYAQYAQTLTVPGKTYAWRKPGTEGMDPWDRPWIQVDWAELNRMERDIAGYYSHTLPAYGEQQYYELIGKYPQFNQGWDDAPAAFTYGDPLTPHFLWYSNERGKANTYYENATRWVTIMVVNHLLSAVDAVWSASIFNRAQASVSMRVLPTETGSTMMSMLNVKFAL